MKPEGLKKLTAKEILRTVGELRAEQSRRESAALIRRNKKHVGKCFSYLNSYGSSYPKWTMYAKVTRIDADGNLHGFTFQKTSMNIYEAQFEKLWFGRGIESFNLVDKQEFEEARRQFLDVLASKLK